MPFERPTMAELTARAETDLDSAFAGSPLRRSDRKALARVLAGAAHGQYGFLDFMSRQLFPNTAEAEFLARHGAFWLKEGKKAAAAAGGPVDFSGNDGAVIPAGTVLQNGDGTEYSTDADAAIAGGAAQAQVAAKLGGAAGNMSAGENVSFVTPVAGVDSTATVAAGGIVNGVDEESDAAYLDRIMLRIQKPPKGGADADYEAWAREVTAVTRAWVYPLYTGLGTVGVAFVLDDDPVSIIPDGAKVTEVQDYIDALAPNTAAVAVFAPTPITLDFTISVTPGSAAVKAAVEEELRDLLRRDSRPGGTLLLSRFNEAISLAEGETDHGLTAPAADVAYNPGEIAIFGAITWA